MGGRLVSFWAPCSGSGVTTLTAHTAAALATQGPIALVDLNLYEPSLGLLTDAVRLSAHGDRVFDTLFPQLRGRRLDPDALTGHLVTLPATPNLHILPGPADPLLAVQVQESDIHQLLDLLLSAYPLVLADLGPTVDSVSTWPVLERAHHVVWVTGAHFPGRYHGRRYLALRSQLGLTPERCTLVCNLTRPLTPGQLADELQVQSEITVPHTPALPSREESGRLASPSPRFARAVTALAAAIRKRAAEPSQEVTGPCPASTS